MKINENGETKQRYIKDIEIQSASYPEYVNRINDDVSHTLKPCGGDGRTYSKEQKKLMVWYTYFFLNRGKPATHIEAFSKIANEMQSLSIPAVFVRMISAAEKLLREAPYENCCTRKMGAM